MSDPSTPATITFGPSVPRSNPAGSFFSSTPPGYRRRARRPIPRVAAATARTHPNGRIATTCALLRCRLSGRSETGGARPARRTHPRVALRVTRDGTPPTPLPGRFCDAEGVHERVRVEAGRGGLRLPRRRPQSGAVEFRGGLRRLGGGPSGRRRAVPLPLPGAAPAAPAGLRGLRAVPAHSLPRPADVEPAGHPGARVRIRTRPARRRHAGAAVGHQLAARRVCCCSRRSWPWPGGATCRSTRRKFRDLLGAPPAHAVPAAPTAVPAAPSGPPTPSGPAVPAAPVIGPVAAPASGFDYAH